MPEFCKTKQIINYYETRKQIVDMIAQIACI